MSFVGTGSAYYQGLFGSTSSQVKPFSAFGYYKRAAGSTGNAGGLIGLGTTAALPASDLGLRANSGNNYVLLEDTVASTVSNTNSTTTFNANPFWYAYGGAVRNLSYRTLYNPDGTIVTNTTTQAACNYDCVAVGTDVLGGVVTPVMAGHQIAEVAIWLGVELEAGEFAALIAGENPGNISRENLAFYFPLIDTQENLGGVEIQMSPFGNPGWGDHPNVLPRTRHFRYYTGPSTDFATLNAVQSPNLLTSGTAVAIIGAALSATQSAELLVAAASNVNSGSVALSQAAQTLSAHASVIVGATLSESQAAETLAATAKTGNSGFLSLSQAAETLSATANSGPALAALTVNQAAETLASTGTIPNGAALTVAQSAQILVSAGGPIAGLVLTIAEAAESFIGAGGVALASATLTVAQAAQTLAASGTANAFAGLSTSQAAQTFVGVAGVRVGGALASAAQAAETISAAAFGIQPLAALTVNQAAETITAAASFPILSGLTALQAPNTLSSIISVTGNVGGLSLYQAAETLFASSNPMIIGRLVQPTFQTIFARAQAGPVASNPTYTFVATLSAPNWWPKRYAATSRVYALDVSSSLQPTDLIINVAASIAPSGAGEMEALAVYVQDNIISLLVDGGQPTRVYTVKFVMTITQPDIIEITVHQMINRELEWHRAVEPPSTDFGTEIWWSGGMPLPNQTAPYFLFT